MAAEIWQAPDIFRANMLRSMLTPSANGIVESANPDGQDVFSTRYNMLTLSTSLCGQSAVAVWYESGRNGLDFYSRRRTMMYDPAVTATLPFAASDQLKGMATAHSAMHASLRGTL